MGVFRYVMLGCLGATVVITFAVPTLIYYGKKQKELLMLKVSLKRNEKFLSTLQSRLKKTAEYLAAGDYSNPLFPPFDSSIDESEWQTCFDLNPDCRHSNWIGFSEYLSLCHVEDKLNIRQAVAEFFLSQFQQTITNIAGLPFPLSWFLPSSLTEGSIPLHPQHIIQSSVVLTPSILTSFVDIQNFKDRDMLHRKHYEFDGPESPLHAKFPTRIKLSSVYDYYEEEEQEPPPEPVHENLFPGLMKGLAPHNKPVFTGKHARRNLIFAEICSRLGKNFAVSVGITSPEGGSDIFTVVMPDNTEINRLDDLLAYLMDKGCKCKCGVKVSTAVMNFTCCIKKSELLDEDNEGYFDVPFGLFTRTGIYSDKYKSEAIIPINHGGMRLTCEGELEGFGEISFELHFYLGFNSPARWNARNGGYDAVTWNLGKLVEEWKEEEDVLRCARLVGWHSSIINSVSIKNNLYANGYGLIGVCSDSVAPIQYALSGKTTLYPLFAVGEYTVKLIKEIATIMDKVEHSKDRECLESLTNALQHIPSDVNLDPKRYTETLHRIMESIPWEEGKEPFARLVIARKIIQAEIDSSKLNKN